MRMWGFPKLGNPNIVPQIVGSNIERAQNKVPYLSEAPKSCRMYKAFKSDVCIVHSNSSANAFPASAVAKRRMQVQGRLGVLSE